MKKPNVVVSGFFKHGTLQMQGICRVIVDNQTIIEGHYENDKLNGFVRIIYFDGMRYEGQCRDGFREGRGELVRASGQVLRGVWRQGRMVEGE